MEMNPAILTMDDAVASVHGQMLLGCTIEWSHKETSGFER